MKIVESTVKTSIWLAVILGTSSAMGCDFGYTQLPSRLSETCLFESIQLKKVNPVLLSFTPQFPLWSDGAQKNRYIYIPSGTLINTQNPNHWEYPVGTVFFKEFIKNKKRLEVRILKKVKDGPKNNWIFGTYAWNVKETEGHLQEWAVSNYKNTGHDIPSRQQCMLCHGMENYQSTPKRQDMRPLGFNAIDLAQPEIPLEKCKKYWKAAHRNSTDIDLEWLIQNKKLNQVYNWALTKPAIPGNSTDMAALGYFHNNCASCHATEINGGWIGTVSFTEMQLRAMTDTSEMSQTPAYQSLVDKPSTYYRGFENLEATTKKTLRINTQNPEESVVLRRFLSTVPGEKMPSTGSRTIDPYGACVLKEWVKSLN